MNDKIIAFVGVYCYCMLGSSLLVAPIITMFFDVDYNSTLGCLAILSLIPSVLAAGSE